MRTVAFMAFLLAILTGCIHLPPEVAAVVREADPPGLNNYLPEPPPEHTATHGEHSSP